MVSGKFKVQSKACFLGKDSNTSVFGDIYTDLPIGIGFQTEQKGRVWEAVKIGKNGDGLAVVDFRPIKKE